MFIWKSTKKRCNPFAAYTDENGTRYAQVPAELYEQIADPVRGNDETQYTREIDEAPYVVIEDKPADVLAREKQERTNIESLAYLRETDWMVTRFAETGTPIPDDIKQKRQQARDAIVKVAPNAG